MLNHAQRAAIQAALGYLLDEDKAAAAAADTYGEERERFGPWDDSEEESWLESKTGCTAAELQRAAFELAHPQTQLVPDAGEPRFTVSDWTNADGSVTSCVVDNAQVGSDGERLILARDVDKQTAETVQAALELSLIPAPESSQRAWLIPAPWDGPELKLEPAAVDGFEGFGSKGPAAARALFVLSHAAELVESEPSSSDPEEMLARVLLATGALFAARQGSLSQCYRTAEVWERG